MDNTTVRQAWGCPQRYLDAESFVRDEIPDTLRRVDDVAGWSRELSDALHAMAYSCDFYAMREWAESPAWDHIALARAEPRYADDVRSALCALADEIEEELQ